MAQGSRTPETQKISIRGGISLLVVRTGRGGGGKLALVRLFYHRRRGAAPLCILGSGPAFSSPHLLVRNGDGCGPGDHSSRLLPRGRLPLCRPGPGPRLAEHHHDVQPHRCTSRRDTPWRSTCRLAPSQWPPTVCRLRAQCLDPLRYPPHLSTGGQSGSCSWRQWSQQRWSAATLFLRDHGC